MRKAPVARHGDKRDGSEARTRGPIRASPDAALPRGHAPKQAAVKAAANGPGIAPSACRNHSAVAYSETRSAENNSARHLSAGDSGSGQTRTYASAHPRIGRGTKCRHARASGHSLSSPIPFISKISSHHPYRLPPATHLPSGFPIFSPSAHSYSRTATREAGSHNGIGYHGENRRRRGPMANLG